MDGSLKAPSILFFCLRETPEGEAGWENGRERPALRLMKAYLHKAKSM